MVPRVRGGIPCPSRAKFQKRHSACFAQPSPRCPRPCPLGERLRATPRPHDFQTRSIATRRVGGVKQTLTPAAQRPQTGGPPRPLDGAPKNRTIGSYLLGGQCRGEYPPEFDHQLVWVPRSALDPQLLSVLRRTSLSLCLAGLLTLGGYQVSGLGMHARNDVSNAKKCSPGVMSSPGHIFRREKRRLHRPRPPASHHRQSTSP